MPGLLFLSESDVRGLLDPDQLAGALAEAFRELSRGRAVVPPRTAAATPRGFLAVMPGFLPGTALETKLVSVFPGNHDHGLPSHQALIVLFDELTGTPLAVMDGTYITAVRTAAAAALAAAALAREDARVLAILGAGVQGRSHLDALVRIRDFRDIRIASRDPEHAATLATEHLRARVVPAFAEAVRGADVVCCCTDAGEPIVDARWLQQGAHVSSVGSGRELDAATIGNNRVFVEWRGAARHPPPAGAHELQGIDEESLTEMGEVLDGTRPGRVDGVEITVYKSTGHAVEDAVAARLVYDGAERIGAGVRLDLSAGRL